MSTEKKKVVADAGDVAAAAHAGNLDKFLSTHTVRAKTVSKALDILRRLDVQDETAVSRLTELLRRSENTSRGTPPPVIGETRAYRVRFKNTGSKKTAYVILPLATLGKLSKVHVHFGSEEIRVKR